MAIVFTVTGAQYGRNYREVWGRDEAGFALMSPIMRCHVAFAEGGCVELRSLPPPLEGTRASSLLPGSPTARDCAWSPESRPVSLWHRTWTSGTSWGRGRGWPSPGSSRPFQLLDVTLQEPFPGWADVARRQSSLPWAGGWKQTNAPSLTPEPGPVCIRPGPGWAAHFPRGALRPPSPSELSSLSPEQAESPLRLFNDFPR